MDRGNLLLDVGWLLAMWSRLSTWLVKRKDYLLAEGY